MRAQIENDMMADRPKHTHAYTRIYAQECERTHAHTRANVKTRMYAHKEAHTPVEYAHMCARTRIRPHARDRKRN